MTAFPVVLTPTAIAKIAQLIAKDGRPDVFLRVGVKGGGCSGFEYLSRLETTIREGDLVDQHDGFRVVCDPKSAEFLMGSTLDYTTNLIGSPFSFQNPNAQRSCGCGTSFTPKDK